MEHLRIFVVDVVTKAGRVYDGESDAHAVLLEFDMYWFDADALFNVSRLGVVTNLVAYDFGFAQGVDKRGLSCTGGADDHKTEGNTLFGRASTRGHAGVDDGRNGDGYVGVKTRSAERAGEGF